MNIITAYLYESLDIDIYMKIPEGFKMPETSKFREMYAVKLQRSLYELKQFGRMWYNKLNEYLLKEGHINNPICPCIFIRKTTSSLVIIVVYVDDLNIIGTNIEIKEAKDYLKKDFKMEYLRKPGSA